MLAYRFQPTGALELVDVEVGEPAPGDVVLDVLAAGVCGTDLKIARGEHRLFPAGTSRTPGHEVVGRVVAAEASTGTAPGDVVVLAPNLACAACAACRAGRPNLCLRYESVGLTMDGGFAEQVLVPARAVAQGNLMPAPAGMDPALGSLTEPLAAVLRGLRAVDAEKGQSLLVIGAGPIGLLTLLSAKLRGLAPVIVSQPTPDRRRLAVELGADIVVDPESVDLVAEVQRVTSVDGVDGVDIVMVTTPVPGVYRQAVDCAALGGRVNFFAGLPAAAGEVTIDANLVHYRELRITGTTANSLADCREALELLSAHPEVFRPLLTHRFPLKEAADAFAAAAEGRAIKAVIEP